jgi:hypothetical protein
MSIASELLQRHIETLVDDNAKWQTLIADDIVWELAYGPSLGDPARLSGRAEVLRHVSWFLGAVENFRFFSMRPSFTATTGACTGSTHRRHLTFFGTFGSRTEYHGPRRVKISHLRRRP